MHRGWQAATRALSLEACSSTTFCSEPRSCCSGPTTARWALDWEIQVLTYTLALTLTLTLTQTLTPTKVLDWEIEVQTLAGLNEMGSERNIVAGRRLKARLINQAIQPSVSD